MISKQKKWHIGRESKMKKTNLEKMEIALYVVGAMILLQLVLLTVYTWGVMHPENAADLVIRAVGE